MLRGTSASLNRLDQPSLAPLVDELARRYESGSPPIRVTVPPLSDAGERALADILGLDGYLGDGGRAGSSRSLSVERLAVALGSEVRFLVEDLRGPFRDRRAERTADARRRNDLWDWLTSEATKLTVLGSHDHARSWVDRVRRAGIPEGDVSAHRQRLDVAVRVLQRLPSEGTSLASLGADASGDAHLLETGRRVGRLVSDALAIAAEIPVPTDGAGVRNLWEQAGVVVDPLSSTVLVLGLRSGGDSPLARWMTDAADVGEPLLITLSQLTRWRFLPPADAPVVYVVENPAVLCEAAAAKVYAPMLCTGGWPSVAAVTLIRALRTVGVTVRQHADLDSAGLRITAWLTDRLRTVPWEMTAAAYRRALDAVPESPPITGHVPDTPWDPELAELMRRHRRAIHEESIRHDVLRSMTG